MGASERALRTAQKAAKVLDAIGCPRTHAVTLQLIAAIHLTNGDLEEAVKVATTAKALFKKVDDRKGEGIANQTVVNAAIDAIIVEAKKMDDIKRPEEEIEDPIDY